MVLANVPSFRFPFRVNIRMYPRSCFRSGRASKCTLVPVLVPGEHPPTPPFWKPPLWQPQKKGGSFLLTARSLLLTVGLCYLRWSFLLTVEIRFGLFCLRWKIGLVFFAYGGKSVWSFLLTVPPVQKIGFGLFYLRFPHRK